MTDKVNKIIAVLAMIHDLNEDMGRIQVKLDQEIKAVDRKYRDEKNILKTDLDAQYALLSELTGVAVENLTNGEARRRHLKEFIGREIIDAARSLFKKENEA